MSWLFIDTTVAGTCRVGVLIENGKGIHTVAARSGSLLPLLAAKIGLSALKKTDGVCVVAGPGSFSSVRGGVLVANLLSRFLKKPLVGIPVSESKDLAALFEQLRKRDILSQPFVAPVYDAEPNITVKPA